VKARPSSKYRIQFIGQGGRLLHESLEPKASYPITGAEGYVRARVLESNGRRAWIQPVRVRPAQRGIAQRASWMLGGVVMVGLLAQWRRSRTDVRPRDGERLNIGA
jgi:hypothetical protein